MTSKADHGSTRRNADQTLHCIKSALLRADPRSILCFALVLIAGCKPAPPTPKPKAAETSAAETYHFPVRPSVAPPPVKVFHQDEDTYTLITKVDATDDEISAIIWQFRDAAHNKSFDKLHLSEKWVDTRKPTVWFHVYRGAKCANEKFVSRNYPCGAKYNGAGDYTLGGYTNPLWDDGVLHHADGTETKLWDPDGPTTAPH